ncbi:MAG: hypothetical protein ABWY08_20040 [Comamonas sp.]
MPSVAPVRRVRIAPNARCPVCSSSVYFYDLVNTGRVYFDELGAPWPKHPCTDKLSEFNAGAVNAGDAIKWVTVVKIEVELADKGMLRLSGKMPEGNLLVYVSVKNFEDAQEPAEFLRESFIQTRLSSSGKFDLALLTPDARPQLVPGYVKIADAAANS